MPWIPHLFTQHVLFFGKYFILEAQSRLAKANNSWNPSSTSLRRGIGWWVRLFNISVSMVPNLILSGTGSSCPRTPRRQLFNQPIMCSTASVISSAVAPSNLPSFFICLITLSLSNFVLDSSVFLTPCSAITSTTLNV